MKTYDLDEVFEPWALGVEAGLEAVTEGYECAADCPACHERDGKIGEKVREFSDQVNHPSHYTSHPSGVECIQITEHMGFNLGNAVKYVWRADLKGKAIEDLEKAAFYIDREIKKRKVKP